MITSEKTVFKTSIKQRQEFLENKEDTSSDSDCELSREKEEHSIPNLDSEDEEDGGVESRPVEAEEPKIEFENLVHEKPTIPSTPLLQPQEKRLAKDFGYSLDTKLQNDEFFFIDLEKMWYCLSIAIQRQISFSKGYLFLEDLAENQRKNGSTEKLLEATDFSYCFPDHLKLNQTVDNNSNRSSQESWNVKRVINMDEEE